MFGYMRRLRPVSALLLPFLLASALAAQNPDWFPKKDMLTVGVYYYPEAWPESQWARDMQNIRKLGMEYVHMGEFAWYFMEPTEGHYNFDWLEKAVSLADANGLKVILCTPSATPPIWLERAHPEILMVDAQGRTMEHGSREQADWSSPLYREYVSKIDSELAKKLATTGAFGAGRSITNSVTTAAAFPTHARLTRDFATGCVRNMEPSTV